MGHLLLSPITLSPLSLLSPLTSHCFHLPSFHLPSFHPLLPFYSPLSPSHCFHSSLSPSYAFIPLILSPPPTLRPILLHDCICQCVSSARKTVLALCTQDGCYAVAADADRELRLGFLHAHTSRGPGPTVSAGSSRWNV